MEGKSGVSCCALVETEEDETFHCVALLDDAVAVGVEEGRHHLAWMGRSRSVGHYHEQNEKEPTSQFHRHARQVGQLLDSAHRYAIDDAAPDPL